MATPVEKITRVTAIAAGLTDVILRPTAGRSVVDAKKPCRGDRDIVQGSSQLPLPSTSPLEDLRSTRPIPPGVVDVRWLDPPLPRWRNARFAAIPILATTWPHRPNELLPL